MFNTIKVKARWYWRLLIKEFGFCICGARLNFTRHGQGVCPTCGKRI